LGLCTEKSILNEGSVMTAPTILWTRLFGGPQEDYFVRLQLASDGAAYLVGNASPWYRDPNATVATVTLNGQNYSANANSCPVFVTRINANGTEAWTGLTGGPHTTTDHTLEFSPGLVFGTDGVASFFSIISIIPGRTTCL